MGNGRRCPGNLVGYRKMLSVNVIAGLVPGFHAIEVKGIFCVVSMGKGWLARVVGTVLVRQASFAGTVVGLDCQS